MQISKVRVHNFRSICHSEFNLGPLLVLLGPNNHGKSNLIAAIEFVLSAGAKVQEDDFCAFREKEDGELWVEVTFADLTQQERRTFSKYLDSNDEITIRKFASLTEERIEVGYRGWVEEPENWWLQSDAVSRLGTKGQIESEAEEAHELRPLLQWTGRITKARIEEFQRDFIESNRDSLKFVRRLEDGPLLGTKNVAAGTLPDFYLLPAVRDLGDETKVKNTTAFGRLLQRAITEMTERDPRMRDLRERISSIVADLNLRSDDASEPVSGLTGLERLLAAELESWDVTVGIRVVPPELERFFELGTELRVNDGHDTPAERKGHGLQRAILFGLVKAWASVLRESPDPDMDLRPRRASESLIFAFEEPELFLHPHAQRTLNRALRTLSTTPNHQVVLSTHSPHFIDLDDYRTIAIASKPSSEIGTIVRQCNEDLFEGEDDQDKKNRFHMASWINPDRGEMFFAKKVVLVEGETEKVLLPFLAAALGVLDDSISVIDCGSKFNLPLYQRVLSAFEIPYLAVHDEDPVPHEIPEDWTADKVREKRRTYAFNDTIAAHVLSPIASVYVCRPDFEGAAGISRSQGRRKGKALAALDYFSGKDPHEWSAHVRSLVTEAYTIYEPLQVMPTEQPVSEENVVEPPSTGVSGV